LHHRDLHVGTRHSIHPLESSTGQAGKVGITRRTRIGSLWRVRSRAILVSKVFVNGLGTLRNAKSLVCHLQKRSIAAPCAGLFSPTWRDPDYQGHPQGLACTIAISTSVRRTQFTLLRARPLEPVKWDYPEDSDRFVVARGIARYEPVCFVNIVGRPLARRNRILLLFTKHSMLATLYPTTRNPQP
jgi:hypothetical protein